MAGVAIASPPFALTSAPDSIRNLQRAKWLLIAAHYLDDQYKENKRSRMDDYDLTCNGVMLSSSLNRMSILPSFNNFWTGPISPSLANCITSS